MRSKLLLTTFLPLLLLSCKPQLAVRSATWNNWSGGQPGVGGTNYKIVLDNKKQKEFTLSSLTIDGEEVSPEVVKSEGDSVLIVVIENKSKSPIITLDNPGPKKPDMRREDPANATITGTLDNKPIKLETGPLTRTKSRNYQ